MTITSENTTATLSIVKNEISWSCSLSDVITHVEFTCRYHLNTLITRSVGHIVKHSIKPLLVTVTAA